LLSIVADSSFVVKDNLFIPPKKSQLEMKERIENILNSSVALSSESEVMITPTCQLGLVGLRHDEKVMSRLFKDMKAGSKLWLTSGYFNLTAQNARLLFETSARLSSTEVLISSPAANAWSNSQGASRNVPKGYAELAAQFLRECPSGLSIRLLEWSGPPGWSYHCKGLWHMDEVCSTTIVGSANFGERSAERDFEIQAVFRSDSPQFRQLLQAELENIRKDCKVVGLADMIGDPERKLAWQWSLLLPWMKKLM
jgi:CDP-diacylglycerol--glycerol-3-phosphate 3-phosphatidyltransferase